MTDGAALEVVLERVAASLPVADGEQMAAAVGLRLRQEPGPSTGGRWRRTVLVAVAVAAVVALVVAVVPTTRHAVADFLGIGAVRVSDAPATGGPYTGLDLGPAVTLEEARTAVDFPVVVPAAPGYEHPGSVHVRTAGSRREVTLVYAPGPDRPVAPVAPVGVLISELRAEPDFGYIKKLFSTGTQIEFVDMGASQGVWISGAVHELVLEAPDGSREVTAVRLAANTLLWSRAGVTYRLEGALRRDEAIAVGSSLG